MSRPEPQPGAQSPPGYRDGREHLADELSVLDLYLRRRVDSFRASLFDADGTLVHELAGTAHHPYIPHGEVDWLLDGVPREQPVDEATDAAIVAAQRRIDQRVRGALAGGTLLPLVRLAQLFQLTDFEYQCLIACLAPELYRRYDTIYAYLHDDIARKRPSVELMLDLFCGDDGDRWSARGLLTDNGVLFEAGLIQRLDDATTLSGASGLGQFLAADGRILQYVLGNDGIDPGLKGCARLREADTPLSEIILPESLKSAVREVVGRRLRGEEPAGENLIVHLYGPEGVGRHALAAAVAAELGPPLLVLDLEAVSAGHRPDELIKRACRESLLLQAPLCLENAQLLLEEGGHGALLSRSVHRWVAEMGWLTFALSPGAWSRHGVPDGVRLESFELPTPDAEQRAAAWSQCLGGSGGEALVRDVSQRFLLTVGRIREAAEEAWRHLPEGQAPGVKELHLACRRASNHALARLARKVQPAYGWNDLVLPAPVVGHLEAVCAQVRQSHRVLSDWGFAHKMAYGRALSALFSGSPGTGKTMAAQVIANELGLDLYQIDLSSVVSKYIGETEKNLARIFDEAQSSNSVLLFDECDALFGKRTEVSDAHDRYANIEVSYLLQRMEEYEGIVILTTNLRKNIDEAFVRRIRFIVEFPFPDEYSRRRIWRAHVPEAAPLADDVDFGFLAGRLTVPGGNIRNIVLNAAFLAAEQDRPIGMAELVDSARREYEKIGKLWDEKQMTGASARAQPAKGAPGNG